MMPLGRESKGMLSYRSGLEAIERYHRYLKVDAATK
jgi:hypothetical protein